MPPFIRRTRAWLLLALVPVYAGMVFVMTWQKRSVWAAAISNDGRLLAVAQGDPFAAVGYGKLEVWDLASFRRLYAKTKRAHKSRSLGYSLLPYRAFAFSADSGTLALASARGEVTLCDASTGTEFRNIGGLGTAVNWMSFCRNGKGLICAMGDGSVRLLDLKSGELSDTLAPSVGHSHFYYFHDIDWLIRRAGRPATITVFDVSSARFVKVKSEIANTHAYHMAYVPTDNQLTIITGSDILTLNANSWEIKTLSKLSFLPYDLRFTPNGLLAAAGSQRGMLEVTDLKSGAVKATLPDSTVGPHDRLILNPDGESLVVVSDGGVASVWDLASGQRKGAMSSHRWRPFWLAFVSLAYVIWATVWVRADLRRQRSYRPLFDVLLLNIVLLSIFILGHITRSEMAQILVETSLASLVGILITWSVVGAQRWSFRLAGTIAGIAICWGLFMVIWGTTPGFNIAILFSCFLVGEIAFLKTWKLFGMRLVHQCNGEISALDSGWNSRFSVLDVVLWVSSIACLLAVARNASLQPIDWKNLSALIVSGFGAAITINIGTWVGLGSGARTICVPLGAMLVALCAWVCYMLLPSSWGQNWQYQFVFHFALVMLVVQSMLVFRVHGYRLGR